MQLGACLASFCGGQRDRHDESLDVAVAREGK
jgi:hypothetical protein